MQHESVDSSAGHLSVRIDGRPEIVFQFAQQPKRLTSAFVVTLAVQLAVLSLLMLASRSQLRSMVIHDAALLADMVFVTGSVGPGGGGGGGGNHMEAPARQARIPKPKPLAAITPVVTPEAPTPPQFNIPVTTLATTELPGAIVSLANLSTSSQGPGSGGGGDNGRGLGVGIGVGTGLGPGTIAGIGGGPLAPGTGAVDPVPVYRAEPQYTAAAVTAHISGEVWVECTVLPSGACVAARVIRSLDPRFGLDQEAIRTAERWRFRPGRDKQGRAVSFVVSIAVEFNLR